MAFAEMTPLLGETAPGAPPAPEEAPSPPTPPGTDAAVAELYRQMQGHLEEIFESVRLRAPFTIARLSLGLVRIIDSLTEGDSLLVEALDRTDIEGGLAAHSLNVCVFALKIAMATGAHREELPWLGLGALLHDVGMLRVPSEILAKPGPLSAAEREVVRRHPEEGHEILKGLGGEYARLATIALEEHEREDGSGYPRGLRGDAIHDHAKLVGLADVYEALTHDRPYRRRLIPFDAVREIVASERRAFPERILKGLIQGLSTFPVGSLVRLNTEETGRVVATNPGLPLRPTIEILYAPGGEPLQEPRRVDLSQNSLLYIVDSAGGEEPRAGGGR